MYVYIYIHTYIHIHRYIYIHRYVYIHTYFDVNNSNWQTNQTIMRGGKQLASKSHDFAQCRLSRSCTVFIRNKGEAFVSRLEVFLFKTWSNPAFWQSRGTKILVCVYKTQICHIANDLSFSLKTWCPTYAADPPWTLRIENKNCFPWKWFVLFVEDLKTHQLMTLLALFPPSV